MFENHENGLIFSSPQQFGPKCRLGNNPIWWTSCKEWFVSPRIQEIPRFHRTKVQHKKGPNLPILSKLLLNHLPWPARKIYRCAKSISLYPINYWMYPRICWLPTWKSPYLWDEVSIPVPITSPPTVKSSSSGKIGMVHPNLFKVLLNWPIETRGSQRTVLKLYVNFKRFNKRNFSLHNLLLQ